MRIAGQIEIDIELLEIALLSPRPEEFFQPGGTTAPPPDVLFADGVDAVDLRLLDDGLHLLVEGLLDDETPLVFLVDTGAGGNIIDRGAAERLGLPLQGRIKTLGVGGAEEASFVDIATVEFGGVKVVDQSWLTADFSALGRLFGIRPAAVLGYDLLSRVVLDVDYPQRRVVVRRPGTFAPPAGATSVPIRMDSNVPSIEVEIEGVKTWVHVDTGSDSGLDLGSPFVDEHDLLEGREIEGEAALLGVGGSTTSQRGRIATLRIGDLLLQDVPAGFHRAEGGIFANASIGGILGAGVLSQFRCVLDYPDRTFHLIRVEER